MTAKRKDTESRADGVPAFTELASSDPAASRRFLEKVFGWTFESTKMPMGDYLSYRTSGGGQGGIRATQSNESPTSTNYVRVADLDAALQKIKRAGGDVVLPRVDVPGMGSFFWFRIPSGPVMACWQDASKLPDEE
jgi:uncharacterized protein